MNKVQLTGRLTKDPELSIIPNSDKAVCKFTIAVDRRKNKDGKTEADFIRCVAWNKTAETIANYLSKGRRIGIVGRIQTGSYEDKNGEKKYTFDVLVDEMEFLDKKDNQGQQENYYNGDSEMIEVNDDSIPF